MAGKGPAFRIGGKGLDFRMAWKGQPVQDERKRAGLGIDGTSQPVQDGRKQRDPEPRGKELSLPAPNPQSSRRPEPRGKELSFARLRVSLLTKLALNRFQLPAVGGLLFGPAQSAVGFGPLFPSQLVLGIQGNGFGELVNSFLNAALAE